MRATLAIYFNDIVSLTVMALMVIALIAGQTDAAAEAAAEAAEAAAANAEPVMVINVDFSIRQESE